MANVIFNETLDRKMQDTEDKFRLVLEQSLSSILERAIPVRAGSAELFEYKELKAALPGEVVCVTLTATEGGPGKMLFALTKEGAAQLGDLLLMGDGTAAFSHDEHIEPLRDLFKEVIAAFASNLSLEIGHRVAFDDVKTSLVDLTPADFVGTGWVMSRIEIGVEPPQFFMRMISQDFYETCFPESELRAEAQEGGGEESDESPAEGEIGLVMDIELPINIELGRTSMLIRDIVRLAPGSIVELDKLSGEPVDLYVNGRLFARGEVVVVDENFAVRLTELVVPGEYSRNRHN